MLIDFNQKNETRIAIVNDKKLIDYESEKVNNNRTKGNIYLAKIVRVEPSLQAAFVDYGANRHGFLAYNEIHPDYFKIPTSDKKKLLEQELAVSNEISAENDEEYLNDSDEVSIETNQNEDIQSQKGFLNKVFDFFNYKPIDDYAPHKVKRRKPPKLIQKEKTVIFHRKYSIQEVIKSNQVILIQVVKEERGNKGAAVTTRLSLAGKYCVLMPNTNKGGGISRKIIDLKLRKKLKDALIKLNIKKGMGVIIRTAGQNIDLKEVKRDYGSLIKLWATITSRTIKSNAPCLIHEEDNLIKRTLRDYFDNTYREVIINDKKVFSISKTIVKQFMPTSEKLLKLYKERKPLFSNYGIEKQIIDLNNPVVKLKSGGYLVINQTEALVAIDINSGKSTKQRNIEDTAVKTNLEAAEEIATQIKIRDLAGLIVIDFIDMLDRSNNSRVERRLKEMIKHDRARVQCGRISNFGLLELSRQRLKISSDTINSLKCKFCNGYGSTLSEDFFSDQLIRVYREFESNNPKKTHYLLTSEKLKRTLCRNIEELKKSEKNSFSKINIKSSTELSDLEYLIYNNNEILLKNYNGKISDDEIIKLVKNFKKENTKQTTHSEQTNQKQAISNKNKSLSNKNDVVLNKDDVVLNRRKSYRAKANEFNEKKLPKKIKTKIDVKNKSLSNFQKNKKSEKRQGWWTQ